MQFHFHANQSHFHKNGFALRLALKQRDKGTRKWSIKIRYSNNVEVIVSFVKLDESWKNMKAIIETTDGKL